MYLEGQVGCADNDSRSVADNTAADNTAADNTAADNNDAASHHQYLEARWREPVQAWRCLW